MKSFNAEKEKFVVGGGKSEATTLAIIIICIIVIVYFMYKWSIGRYEITNTKTFTTESRIFKIHNAHKNQAEALSIMAEVDKKIKLFIAQHPDKKIQEKYNKIEFYENSPHSGTTSYVNDAMIALCIRDEYGEFHDFNTIMFVALHELGHIATADHEEDHGPVYWRNFADILEKAEKIGIVTNIDYKKHPTKYCGLDITFNPYIS